MIISHNYAIFKNVVENKKPTFDTPKVSDFVVDFSDDIIKLSLDLYGETTYTITLDSIDLKFKQICLSLKDGIPFHNFIKRFLIDNKLSANKTYPLLLDYIYDSNDFTILFENNKYYECNKLILMTNKYFNKLLTDCDNSANEIYVITDYDMTILIIKMLYNKFTKIYPSEFCKLFELMDMMLMDEEYVIKMLKILEEKLDSIINFELVTNNINNLEILIEHLKNIFESIYNYSYDTMKLSHKLYIKIFEMDFGVKTLYFHNWQNLFSDSQKLNAIFMSKNLELLNVSKISFMCGINFFKSYDFKNDCYTDVEAVSDTNLSATYFKYNNVTIKRTDCTHKIIVLSEWYPIFTADIFKRLNVKIIALDDNWITLHIDTYRPGKICVNSQILIGYDISNSENIYTVEEIIKCYNDKQVNVNKALYISNIEITYKIKVNRTLSQNYNDMIYSISKTNWPIWTIKQIRHRVDNSS